MPPIIWTSKWRIPRTRDDASLTAAKAFREDVVEGFAVVESGLELVGECGEVVVH